MAGEKFLNKVVVLRNGDIAFVSRIGYTGKNILVGTYKDKPFTWFTSGFWRMDGPEGNSKHTEWDIVKPEEK